jgi:hypothetical protein
MTIGGFFLGLGKSIANFLFYVCYMIPFGLIIDEKSKVTVVKGEDGEPDKRITVRKLLLLMLIFVPLSLITFVLGGFLLTIFAVIFGWITIYKKIKHFNKTQGVEKGTEVDPSQIPDEFKDRVKLISGLDEE